MSEQIEPKKVMVIEDNELNQKIASMIINQLGHNVIQIRGGREAVESVRSEKPDLIILDIKLPDVSGTEICKTLKKDPELKNIPVIVITSLSSDEDKKSVIDESGCDNYIAKPFMPHMFAGVISRYIRIKSVDWGL